MSNDLEQAHKLITEGWGALGGAETAKQQHQQAVERYEFAQAVAAAFVGKGKLGLQNLRTQFYDPPTWTPHVTNIDDTTAYGFIREGQKSVIQFIENCIKIAAEGPPKAPEQPNKQE